MRHASCILALLLAAACAPAPATGGADGGEKAPKHEYIPVSGTVQFHPLEVAWRSGTLGVPPVPPDLPTLAGVTFNVENSVDALLGRPPLASMTLGADGKFSFDKVDVVNVSVALVGSVSANDQVMESGYGLNRYEPGVPRPTSLTDKPVYVITKAFEQHLADATGGALATSDLEVGGFVLGQIIDKDGNGVAGAQLAKEVIAQNGFTPVAIDANTDGDTPLYYLNADLTGLATDNQTSASGAFLFFPGGTTSEYTAIKTGASFESHLAGARRNTALTFFVEEK